jgi:hypothetical protein
MFATFKVYRISQKKFPNIHGGHNKANAFRHALWNILIAQKCARFSENINDVLEWTKQITDWHEEFSPNEEMAKAMDLHNNQKGREYFIELMKKKEKNTINYMMAQLEHSVKVKEISDIRQTDYLVYLED